MKRGGKAGLCTFLRSLYHLSRTLSYIYEALLIIRWKCCRVRRMKEEFNGFSNLSESLHENHSQLRYVLWSRCVEF